MGTYQTHTEIYVNPALGTGNGGNGTTDALAYGSLEDCFSTDSFDAVNGTRINVKNTASAVLTAPMQTLLLTGSWTGMTAYIPLIIQGYASTAGDLKDTGLTSTIDGGGSQIWLDLAQDSVVLMQMHFTNTGTGSAFDVNNSWTVFQCKFSDCNGAFFCDVSGLFIQNYVTNCRSTAFTSTSTGLALANYIDCTAWTSVTGQAVACSTTLNNIVICGSNADGVSAQACIMNNTVVSEGGTGQAVVYGNNGYPFILANNIFEGFSGVGGAGLLPGAGTPGPAQYYAGNYFYNNTTDVATGFAVDARVEHGNELAASVSALTDLSTYNFQPVDVGSVKEGSFPKIIGGNQV